MNSQPVVPIESNGELFTVQITLKPLAGLRKPILLRYSSQCTALFT